MFVYLCVWWSCMLFLVLAPRYTFTCTCVSSMTKIMHFSVCLSVCVCVCVCVFMFVCMYVCMHACMPCIVCALSTLFYVCGYVRIACTYTNVCMHTCARVAWKPRALSSWMSHRRPKIMNIIYVLKKKKTKGGIISLLGRNRRRGHAWSDVFWRAWHTIWAIHHQVVMHKAIQRFSWTCPQKDGFISTSFAWCSAACLKTHDDDTWDHCLAWISCESWQWICDHHLLNVAFLGRLEQFVVQNLPFPLFLTQVIEQLLLLLFRLLLID